MKRKLRLKFKISENDIKLQVKQYLSLKGWFHFHLMAGMGAYKGSPDRIAVKDGRVLFLEIKKPVGWKHSDHQKQFQKDTREHSGEYYLIKCLDDLIEVIKEG
ncbi:MAG: hypothetical protein KAW56_07085 [Candidatus Marinimicrobia bacterium]|nr:hypothetical protein [Candidatus Neomarinimicrobiota bacterium]